jgi:hypothetical protein
MNAKKVLKRIAKIESLMLKVTERSSEGAPHMHELLREAHAAISRAKKAVRLQASSGAATNPPAKGVKHRPTPKPSIAKRTLPVARKKAASTVTKVGSPAKKAAAKPEPAIARKDTTRDSAPVKVAKAPARKVAKKAPAKKMAVKATVKESRKKVSTAPKAGSVKKVAAKPEPIIARKGGTSKKVPVKAVKAPVHKFTKKDAKKSVSAIPPASETANVDQLTKQPAELGTAATPDHGLPEIFPGDGTI